MTIAKFTPIRAHFSWALLCTAIFMCDLATAQVNAAVPSSDEVSCRAEDLREQPHVQAKDIVGMYRHSVEGLPAYLWSSDEKRTGYNYLAITSLGGDRLRLKLVTKEINGHDCNLDSQALFVGESFASYRMMRKDQL